MPSLSVVLIVPSRGGTLAPAAFLAAEADVDRRQHRHEPLESDRHFDEGPSGVLGEPD